MLNTEKFMRSLITSENTAKSFEAAEKSLNLIALFVQLLIIVPRIFAIAFGWDYGYVAKLHCQSPCFVPFIGPIHQEINWMVSRAELLQKSTALRCIATVSCGQRKHYPISIRCGDHMETAEKSV